jgi:hypothetical protein
MPAGSSVIDTGNSSTTLLGANATFTGIGADVMNFNGIRLYARQSGGKSAALGFKLQWSHDNITFRDVGADQFTVQNSTVFSISRPIRAKFYRVVYTNGSSPQAGFQLQTTLMAGTDISTTIDAEARLLPAQERSGRVGVTGSVGNASTDQDIVTAQGGRLYIKTIVYSAFNNDEAFGQFRIRDNAIEKIPFIVPKQVAADAAVPHIAGVIDFGDTPMTFNTSVRLAFVSSPGLFVSLAVHGYEEFLI